MDATAIDHVAIRLDETTEDVRATLAAADVEIDGEFEPPPPPAPPRRCTSRTRSAPASN
jgi:hypothetical protein